MGHILKAQEARLAAISLTQHDGVIHEPLCLTEMDKHHH